MRKKYDGEAKRRPASQGKGVSKLPRVDCDSKYSASGLELQAEIAEKFQPKKRRGEAVAGLYHAVADRFSPPWPGAPGWEDEDALFGHPIEEYWKLVGEKRCVDTVYRLMAHWNPDKLLATVAGLCFDWYAGHGVRVNECGTLLEFRVAPERAALHHANFCRDRLCPLCNWRRSLKIFGQVSKVMNVLDKERYRYLFLTLTIRNVWGDDLSDAVQTLYKGWRMLYNKYMSGKGSQSRTAEKRLKGVVMGTFRALEVTVSNGEKSPGWEGSFHPHLHVILAVKPEYFQRGHYLTAGEWAEIWGKACGLNYNPSINIEAVRPKAVEAVFPDAKAAPEEVGKTISYAGAVAELSKYPMKDADYNCDADYGEEKGRYLSWVVHALRGRRLVGMTGRFKEIFHELALDDPEDGDLVHVGSDELRLDLNYLVVKCHWRAGVYEKFVYRPKANEGVGTGVSLDIVSEDGDLSALREAELNQDLQWQKRREWAARRKELKRLREEEAKGGDDGGGERMELPEVMKGGGDDGATS